MTTTPTQGPKRLYTTREIASLFRVDERTIRSWKELGLPAVRVAGTVRYHLPHIRRWLATQQRSEKNGNR
jgi:phage terminase Nu1 subunit (DNA packaging protein)